MFISLVVRWSRGWDELSPLLTRILSDITFYFTTVSPALLFPSDEHVYDLDTHRNILDFEKLPNITSDSRSVSHPEY